MHSPDQLSQTLRRYNQSVTTARRTVFAALQGQEPVSMHELIRRVPTIDRASVYRTITLFEQLGIVERLQTGWKYKLELSDAFHDHHHHATCLHCGASFVIPEDQELETLLHTYAKILNFRLERHQLELSGTCQACLTIQNQEM